MQGVAESAQNRYNFFDKGVRMPSDKSMLYDWEPPASLSKKYWAAFHQIPQDAELNADGAKLKDRILAQAKESGYALNPSKGELDRHINTMLELGDEIKSPVRWAKKIELIVEQ